MQGKSHLNACFHFPGPLPRGNRVKSDARSALAVVKVLSSTATAA